MTTKKYMVRPGFWVHGLAREPIEPNSVIDLTAEQAEVHAHQVEPYNKKIHDARVAEIAAAAPDGDEQAEDSAGG